MKFIVFAGVDKPKFIFQNGLIHIQLFSLGLSVFLKSTNLELDETKKKEMEVLFRASGIDTRHTVLKDYSTEKSDFSFFPNTKGLEPFPSVSSRMKIFRKEALKLSLDASRKCIGSSGSRSGPEC